MTNRERALAVLRYEPYDRLPVVHFGYWGETLQKWVAEGYLTEAELQGYGEGNDVDNALAAKIGFDFNWQNVSGSDTWLRPGLEGKVVAELPDGAKHVMGGDGVVYLEKPGAGSIPAQTSNRRLTRRPRAGSLRSSSACDSIAIPSSRPMS